MGSVLGLSLVSEVCEGVFVVWVAQGQTFWRESAMMAQIGGALEPEQTRHCLAGASHALWQWLDWGSQRVSRNGLS